MTDPNPTDPTDAVNAARDLANSFGRLIHGDRWPAVQAAQAERVAEAARAEQREARRERIAVHAGLITFAVLALLLLAILTGAAVDLWEAAL